jgi:ferredoxin like protein
MLPHTNVDSLLASVKYYVDEEFAHIKIKDPAVCAGCEAHPCLYFCPAGVFSLDNRNHIQVSYQACVECGSCRIGCPQHNVGWRLPRGGYGVAYKFG